MSGLLRRSGYRVFARRDGYAGWTRHRNAMRAMTTQSAFEIRRQSLDALRRLLTHAFSTVPFYRDAWTAIGFAPSAHVALDDLQRLPMLTKNDLRDRKEDLISLAVPERDRHIDLTGGTTGTQTSFYRDNACRVARFGRQWGILEQCGYQPGQKRALIWGSHADLGPAHSGLSLRRALRRFASADETLCCTVMTDADMRAYHQRLCAFQPAVVYGYPNAIEQFARFIARERLKPITAGRIFCTAERLLERQRELFQRAFGGDVFNLYCSREHGCVAFECSRHRGFHVDAGSVVLEILRDGRPARPGEEGDIVITDLLNYATPFIRYATGDRATASNSRCDCGSPLPTFAALDGRTADIIHLPNGGVVAGLMLDDLFTQLPEITHAQFVQEHLTSLDVNVVVKPGTDPSIEIAMLAEIRELIGPELTIRIHFVPAIPRNAVSGKFQVVISRVQPVALA